VTLDDYALGLWVVTLVAALVQEIFQEDTANRTWRQLVGSGSCSVRVAETTKDAKMIVVRGCTEQQFERGGVLTGTTGTAI
jgi:hypothetical protein